VRATTLDSVTAVYRCSETCDVQLHKLDHTGFRDFCFGLRAFERALGDDVTDDFWQVFLRRLKRYRFEVTAAPVSFHNPAIAGPELLQELESCIEHCDSLYPTLASRATALLGAYRELSTCSDNPGLRVLFDLFEETQPGRAGLLLSEARLIQPVEKTLAGHSRFSDLEVLTQSQLREDMQLVRLVVFGPARWYGDFVFSAPRAARIDHLQYRWIAGAWRPEPVFPGSIRKAYPSDQQGQSSDPEEGATEQGQDGTNGSGSRYFTPGELVPTLNMGEIARKFGQARAGTWYNEDVETRLYLLEGGWGVFLDNDEQASVLTVDLEGSVPQLRRTPTREIERGMFILLRTEGGGDYIVPIANRLMGAEATRVRELQKLWKLRLRQKVQQYGLQRVSEMLRALGSVRANPGNVRRWMWERSIRTQDFQDFRALMKLTDMGDKPENLWRIMEYLDSAHRDAGRKIRELLLKQILNTDVSELVRSGRMDFQLPQAEGGRFSAFRVERVGSETTMVSPYQEGHPFQTGE
jgi:hypothetical protein